MSTRLLCLAIFCCLLSACADAPVSPTTPVVAPVLPITASGKQAELRLLMQRIKVKETMLRGVQNGMEANQQNLRTKHPDWSPQMIELVNEASLDVTTDKIMNGNEVVERFMEVYARHYNESEIHDLLVFYSSPTGQKVVDTLPLIENEARLVGRNYGETLGVDIAKKVIQKCQKAPPGVCPKGLTSSSANKST